MLLTGVEFDPGSSGSVRDSGRLIEKEGETALNECIYCNVSTARSSLCNVCNLTSPLVELNRQLVEVVQGARG